MLPAPTNPILRIVVTSSRGPKIAVPTRMSVALSIAAS
jgi:hypothetical protein